MENHYQNVNEFQFPLQTFPNAGTIIKNQFIDYSKYVCYLDGNLTYKCSINTKNNIYTKQNCKYFSIQINTNDNSIVILIPILANSIKHIAIDNYSQNYSVIYLHLSDIPKVFMKDKKEYSDQMNRLMRREYYLSNFTMKYKQHYYKNNYIDKINMNDNINNKYEYVQLDSFFSVDDEYLNFYLLNLVMRIHIDFEMFAKMLTVFENMNLKTNIEYLNQTLSKSLISLNISLINHIQDKVNKFNNAFPKLVFPLQYAILSLITQKKINIYHIDTNFISFYSKKDESKQIEASLLIEEIIKDISITNKHLTNFSQFYIDNYVKYAEHSKNHQRLLYENNLNNNLAKIRTIHITPSLIYYLAPMLESTNHFIRMYNQEQYIIRVNFLDENETQMYFNTMKINNKRLLSFLEYLMMESFYIGNNEFRYVIESSSQKKKNSFWAINCSLTQRNQIINTLGNFNSEKNIFKNSARRGQTLSYSRYIITLNHTNIKLIPDVNRNGYIFTDGIGQISFNLVKYINNKLNENSSAFQIRIGGIKGVVAYNPLLNQNDNILCVRNSMKKFESDDCDLNVIKCAKYKGNAFLNRQIILLLVSLGVPSHIFIEMMNTKLQQYNLLYTNLQQAITLNQDIITEIMNNTFYFSPLIKYYFYNQQHRHTTYSSYNINNEPFIKCICHFFISKRLKELKHKCKLQDDSSALLMGVIDESETLEANEIYINIVTFNKETINIKGEVIVTKNPCLHPGDIRIAKAVDNKPHLSHLTNVVVFSSKGHRPLPNTISGGDLDGDLYYVSWNTALLNNITIRNYEPLNDPKYTNEISFNIHNNNMLMDKSNVNVQDIINADINFKNNADYASVSMIHDLCISHADNDISKYSFNEKSMTLAEMFAIQIDSEKSGKFITKTELKNKGLLLNEYPDFLERHCYAVYESQGILGKLYRMVTNTYINEYKTIYNIISYEKQYELDIDFISAKCCEYISIVLPVCIEYCNEILVLMDRFKSQSEVELFIGNEREDDDVVIIDNEFIMKQTLLHKLRFKYTKRLIEVNGGKQIHKDIASAVYVVSYVNKMSLNTLKQKISETYYDIIESTLAHMESVFHSRPRIFSLPF